MPNCQCDGPRRPRDFVCKQVSGVTVCYTFCRRFRVNFYYEIMNDIVEAALGNMANDMLCELEVTVCTGFEMPAKEEIEEKMSSASNLTAARGRVTMLVPINDARNVRRHVAFLNLRLKRT